MKKLVLVLALFLSLPLFANAAAEQPAPKTAATLEAGKNQQAWYYRYYRYNYRYNYRYYRYYRYNYRYYYSTSLEAPAASVATV